MDRIVGTVFILMSIFLLLSLRGISIESAAFPAVLLIVLIGMSIFLFIAKWKTEYYRIENPKHVAVGAVLIVAFTLLLPVLGFFVTTTSMLWLSMWLGGYRKPFYRPPILAVIVAAAIYFVFFRLLDVQPP